MKRRVRGSSLLVSAGALCLAACATATAPPASGPAAPAAAPVAPPAAPPARPAAYQSEDFIVTFAQPGDTPATLAERHLGGADKSWMIEDYTGLRAFAPGQEVVIPRRPWNPAGVTPGGYQIVPILTYHNLGEQAKGRLVLAAASFREQMRYLKTNGYRVVSLTDFIEFTRLNRQLPQRTVVLTFDDGYRAFKDHAYPVLKELGFTATLFIYTDWVGAGRGALSWADLRELAAAGMDIQAHSKTHADLRRAQGETEAQYARRMQAELEQPQDLFNRNLGRRSRVLAYPYGRWEEGLLPKVKEYGYIAAFSVRRQGNASFVRPLAGHRSQIYSEMTLDDFVKNLNVFQEENLR
ncbi:MAG TPA: polysaccharide deacetylase family protein [Methylomirabilota bacterium]|nr:polysaccharide deacetylase family protein [Methylomirabilota bacterium]